MKIGMTLAISAVLAASSALSGCSTISADYSKLSTAVGNEISGANKTIQQVANSDVPTACAAIYVAEGYYTNVKPAIPAKTQAIVASAEKVVAADCANPPTNLSQLWADLETAWTTIQAGTTVPAS
jgi:hypothetical protein